MPFVSDSVFTANSALDISTFVGALSIMLSVRTRPAVRHRAQTAVLFHALSDETRIAVLQLLRDGERCVCELQDELDAAQSRLSFHLKVLRDAGLLLHRKEGRWSYYAIATERLAEAHDLLVSLRPAVIAGRTRLPLIGSCCG